MIPGGDAYPPGEVLAQSKPAAFVFWTAQMVVGTQDVRTSDLLRDTRRFALRFDPTLLTSAQLHKVLDDLCATRAALDTVFAKASAELSRKDTWKQDGSRSFADALAKQTVTSVGAAKDAIETGKRLEDQPRVKDAALNGEISFAQAKGRECHHPDGCGSICFP